MHRTTLAFAIVAVTALGACAGASASSAPPSSTPPPATDEAALVKAAESDRIAALVAGDVDAAAAVIADDFELVDPAGDTETKERYLGSIRSGDLDYVTWKPDTDMVVRVHGDVAVLRYASTIDVDLAGSRIPGRFWQTEYYEKRDGRWQLVWGQTTPIQ